MTPLKTRLTLTVVWWGWMPAAAWLFWAILHFLFGGVGTWEQWWRLSIVRDLWLPGGNLAHPTAVFWLWTAIGLIGTAVILSGLLEEDTRYRKDDDVTTRLLPLGALAAAIVVLAWPTTAALWDNDKDAGRYYNRATVFHITKNTPVPSSLTYLATTPKPGTGNCDAHGNHDVPSCIKRDQLEGIASFEGRTSSFASALQMMQHAASPAPKTDAWESTLTYLYNTQPGKDGVWTTILDGSGKATPTYGIATWDGRTNTVGVGCRFNTGTDNRFDRAFDGQRGNSLRNLLAEKYPDVWYDDADVWGYCQGTRPIIVIPVKQQATIGNRTVETAAGVLMLQGGRHGVAHTRIETVKPGQFPGPVYPISLVEKQREETAWAAGRKWKQRASFGFQPTVDDVQGDNTAEYLLRGADQRLYYVTPLAPNASRSQIFIAYAVAPADVTGAGNLNTLHIYTLPDSDPRAANLNSLVNYATDVIRRADPTFLNTGGKLEEFTPLGGDMWRAYGVRRGLTEFYVDLSATRRVQPKTVSVTGTPAPAPEKTAKTQQAGARDAACPKPRAEMNEREIADCMTVLAEELRRRNGGNS